LPERSLNRDFSTGQTAAPLRLFPGTIGFKQNAKKNARHPERSEGSAFRSLLGCNSILFTSRLWPLITTRHRLANGTISRMNSAALYFASGDSFYLGILLLLVAVVFSPYLRQPWSLLARNTVVWIALALIVMASPPFPWAVDVALFLVFVLWFIAANTRNSSRSVSRARLTAGILLSALLAAFSGSELSHRKMPPIKGQPSDNLVVIGDSISSGIDPRSPSWPVVLQQTTGIIVKNLAKPGATIADARAMAENVTLEDRLVLVEIGGNDLLSGTPSEDFERNLDLLLSKVTQPGRTVVMFELPLLPNRIAYGQIQRRLASKYGVWLIPKRYLAQVIQGADATSDGLHLSPTASQRMAALVAKVLDPVLKERKS
jgi:acyl-CoA thioesterase I